jgi:hypothetical protein
MFCWWGSLLAVQVIPPSAVSFFNGSHFLLKLVVHHCELPFFELCAIVASLASATEFFHHNFQFPSVNFCAALQ